MEKSAWIYRLRSAFLACLLWFHEVAEAKMDCPPDWENLHRACYKFGTEPQTWFKAQELCRSEGGYLASISSIAEKRLVTKQLQVKIQRDDQFKWWVGLHRDNITYKWSWMDGGQLMDRVTPWSPGEPNNRMNQEFCADFDMRGSLSDVDCLSMKPYVCELQEIRSVVWTTTTTSTTASTTTATTTTTTTTTRPPIVTTTTTTTTEASTTPATAAATLSSGTATLPPQTTVLDARLEGGGTQSVSHKEPTDETTVTTELYLTASTTASISETSIAASETATGTTLKGGEAETTSSGRTEGSSEVVTTNVSDRPTTKDFTTGAAYTQSPEVTPTEGQDDSDSKTKDKESTGPYEESATESDKSQEEDEESATDREDEMTTGVPVPQTSVSSMAPVTSVEDGDMTSQDSSASPITEKPTDESTTPYQQTTPIMSTTTTVSTTTTATEASTTTTTLTTPMETEATTPAMTTTEPTTTTTTEATTEVVDPLAAWRGCYGVWEGAGDKDGVEEGAGPLALYQDATACPPITVEGLRWPRTLANTLASVSCKRGSGRATWRCHQNPTCWRGVPLTDACASPEFQNLLSQATEAASDKTSSHEEQTQRTVEVTATLAEVTAKQEVNVEDVLMTSKVISTMVMPSKTGQKKDEKAVKTIVKNVVTAGSNLLSENKTSAWFKMAQEDKVRSVTSLLVAMDTATAAMAEELDKPTVINTKDENIAMELQVVDVTSVTQMTYDDPSAQNRFNIPAATLRSISKDGLAKAVFMTHQRLGDLLEERSADPQSDAPIPRVLSLVLSASLGRGTPAQLPEPVSFTMKLTQELPPKTRPLCSFWDIPMSTQMGQWSQKGCSLVSNNASHVTCQSDHLTNFAILMDVHGVEVAEVHWAMLRYVTLVGCIISALALVASWITFQFFPTLQGERNTIHKNLVVCLFVAEIVFLAGVDKTSDRVGCGVVAGLLHYFLLASFTWMFLEGLHIVFMLVQVFDAAKSRVKYYYLAGYGIPLIVVLVSAAVFPHGYGTAKFCWLTTERFFIWSFAAPVAVILVSNAIILVYSMTMVCRHSEYVFSSKDKESGNVRAWVQGALALEVLLGLTWVFGYFFMSGSTVVFAYLFTVLNSLQGLFIFVFHCLLNKKVRKEYKRLITVQRRPSTRGSTQSASLMRKQDASLELTAQNQSA